MEDLIPEYINDHFNPRIPVTRACVAVVEAPLTDDNAGENSVSGPGIGAVLAQVIWALASEGDGVLMSAVRFIFIFEFKVAF